MSKRTLMPLHQTTGESPFVDNKEGNLYIVAEQLNESAGHQPVSLHAALALFGELVSFHVKKTAGSVSGQLSFGHRLTRKLDRLYRIILRCSRSSQRCEGIARAFNPWNVCPCHR
jgi:hypothetical protein